MNGYGNIIKDPQKWDLLWQRDYFITEQAEDKDAHILACHNSIQESHLKAGSGTIQQRSDGNVMAYSSCVFEDLQEDQAAGD